MFFDHEISFQIRIFLCLFVRGRHFFLTSQGFFVAVGIIYCQRNKISPQAFF